MARLEHKHHEDFANAPLLPFITEITGEVGGKVRTAGGPGAGNVSFVQIFDGGYVLPSPCVSPCVFMHMDMCGCWSRCRRRGVSYSRKLR